MAENTTAVSQQTGRGAASMWSDLAKLHKLGIYILMGVSFLALWGGRAFGMVVGLVCVVFGALSWFWERPRLDPSKYDRFWTVLTVVAIGVCVFLGVSSPLSFVEIGVYFILYLALAKLYQRARLIDHAQLLALSFLMIAAATSGWL